MARFTWQELLEATGGSSTYAGDLVVNHVSTDTRTITQGSLFVALKGDTFDGHDFIDKAYQAGAVAAVVEKGRSLSTLPCLEVDNTLQAYQSLARFHRQRFDIPVVAITGSSGKTTTKEMVASVLGQAYTVLKTEKNFNNEIGLPKTLLELRADHEACVVEMGMRGLGQIEELALIAEPTVGVITNIGTSHIELLGSQDNIAEAKGELLACLPEKGVAVLNSDDAYATSMAAKVVGQVVTYGIDNSAFVTASHLSYRKDGIEFLCQIQDVSFPVFLPMIGIHNVYDALAAIAVGYRLGMKVECIQKGLATFAGIPMRQEIVSLDDMVILNDTYNANPSSMAESVKALGQLQGNRKIAMLGDMLELGDFTEEGHRQIGRLLAEEGYALVYTFGQAAEYIAKEALANGLMAKPCQSHLDMANTYMEDHQPGDVILLKGSRGLKMERVLEELKEIQALNK